MLRRRRRRRHSVELLKEFRFELNSKLYVIRFAEGLSADASAGLWTWLEGVRSVVDLENRAAMLAKLHAQTVSVRAA